MQNRIPYQKDTATLSDIAARSDASKSAQNVIPFPKPKLPAPRPSPGVALSEADALKWAKAFLSQPPDERRRVYFRGRLAGRSSVVTFKLPLRPRSAGASIAPPTIFAEHAPDYISKGFSPMPRFRKREIGEDGTEHWCDIWPKEWRKLCEAPFTGEEAWMQWSYAEANIAFACGYKELVSLDYDWNDEGQRRAILDALPHCRIGRFGSKGFALLVRWPGDMESEEWFRLSTDICLPKPDGTRGPALLEIKGLRRNITVPPSIHAKTGRPYRWINPETGEDIPSPSLEDLPVVSSDDLRRLRAALAPWAYVPKPFIKGERIISSGNVSPKRYQACADERLATYSKELAGMAPGSQNRNKRLFQLSCALGWAVHHGYLSEDELIDAYTGAMDKNGYLKESQHGGKTGVRKTIFQGLNRSRYDELPDLGVTLAKRLPKRKRNGFDHPEDDGGDGGGAAAGDPEEEQPGPEDEDEDEDEGKGKGKGKGKKKRLELLRGEDGKIIKDERNFRRIAGHELWEFSYNEFTGRQELVGLPGYPKLNDGAFAKIRQYCASQYGCKFQAQDLHEIISVVARERRHHPVCDYLSGLEWDGVDRLDEWLMTYLGAKDTPANRAIGRKTLIAAVRRVRHPGCQCKYMMVLEGPQDQGKSKAIAALCPDALWFTDNFSIERHIDSKRVIELTRGKWLVEIPDLDMRRANSESIKPMLSRNTDEDRLSYGRERTEVPRSFIFIGTCNQLVLTDTTGNVRFWPVMCSGEIDDEAILRDRDLLLGEAAHFEARGEAIHLTKDDADAAKGIVASQKAHELGDEIHNALALWTEGATSGTSYSGGSLPLKEIAHQALGISVGDLRKDMEMRIASSLRKLSFKKKESNGITRWKLEKE